MHEISFNVPSNDQNDRISGNIWRFDIRLLCTNKEWLLNDCHFSKERADLIGTAEEVTLRTVFVQIAGWITKPLLLDVAAINVTCHVERTRSSYRLPFLDSM